MMKSRFSSVFSVVLAIMVGLIFSASAMAAQSPAKVYPATNTSGYAAPQTLDALGAVVVDNDGTDSVLNVSASTVIKASAGRVVRVVVTTAGSAPGAVHDIDTVGTAAAGNLIATIPNTVGIYDLNWPAATGIVIVIGTGQVVSVSYK